MNDVVSLRVTCLIFFDVRLSSSLKICSFPPNSFLIGANGKEHIINASLLRCFAASLLRQNSSSSPSANLARNPADTDLSWGLGLQKVQTCPRKAKHHRRSKTPGTTLPCTRTMGGTEAIGDTEAAFKCRLSTATSKWNAILNSLEILNNTVVTWC